MTQRAGKWLAVAALAMLLVPLTLLTALVAMLSYPAYPIPARPFQLLFDAGMVLQVAAILAAWRLALLRVRAGRAALTRVNPAWVALIGVGAVIGIVGAALGAQHMLTPRTAGAQVGYALLSPAVLLSPVWILLVRERRAALVPNRRRGVE